VRGTRREQAALGIKTIPGTQTSRSSIGVPILGGDRVLGVISLENHEREHAYGEAEVRLISTVAASMGVALENARCFDETQRLLKETEKRSSELAVINSIQRGMVEKLDFQAIIDLVATSCASCSRATTWASSGSTARPACSIRCTSTSTAHVSTSADDDRT
jgi:GAF domain-containing protein